MIESVIRVTNRYGLVVPAYPASCGRGRTGGGRIVGQRFIDFVVLAARRCSTDSVHDSAAAARHLPRRLVDFFSSLEHPAAVLPGLSARHLVVQALEPCS